MLEAEKRKNEPVTEKVVEEEVYEDDDYYSGDGEPEVTTKKFVNPIIKFYGPTKKPCVGLCYHYKRLGIPNPYEKKEEKKKDEDEEDGESGESGGDSGEEEDE